MKITFLAVALILSLGPASAQAACEYIEYAELKDMPKELLITKFCDYRTDTYALLEEASKERRTTVALRIQAQQPMRARMGQGRTDARDTIPDFVPELR